MKIKKWIRMDLGCSMLDSAFLGGSMSRTWPGFFCQSDSLHSFEKVAAQSQGIRSGDCSCWRSGKLGWTAWQTKSKWAVRTELMLFAVVTWAFLNLLTQIGLHRHSGQRREAKVVSRWTRVRLRDQLQKRKLKRGDKLNCTWWRRYLLWQRRWRLLPYHHRPPYAQARTSFDVRFYANFQQHRCPAL